MNKVEISSDTAVVTVDWRRVFEDDSEQSGQSATIAFKEKDRKWQITSVSDDGMFIIGKGAIYFTY